VPKFGTKELRRVTRSEVAAWVASMTTPPDGSRGLAPSTVESYFRVLASIFKSARADRLIVHSPCDGVKLPRAERTAAALVPLTIENVHAIADAIPRRYRALVLASAGLGLRQGEACGLTVDRVDFLRRTVRIDRQLVTPKAGAPTLGPVKTKASNRVIPLAESVAFTLSGHLEEFAPGADGLIFTSSTGEPVRRSLWSKVFGNAAKAVGVDASSHDLRHHAASVLLSAGVSIKAVQSFLGHATAAETLDTYGHLMPGDDDRLRAAIDDAVRREGRHAWAG
jgi:integrase